MNINNSLLFGTIVGILGYIAKEQKNKDLKPLKVLVRVVLGGIMGYFLPEALFPIVKPLFNLKDNTTIGILVIMSILLSYGNLRWIEELNDFADKKLNRNANESN